MRVGLVNRATKATRFIELEDMKTGGWAEATVDFTGKERLPWRVDEVQFLLPKGAELLVDDVLVYEPGK